MKSVEPYGMDDTATGDYSPDSVNSSVTNTATEGYQVSAPRTLDIKPHITPSKLELTDREVKLLLMCKNYSQHYTDSGAPGHAFMMLIAKLAGLAGL